MRKMARAADVGVRRVWLWRNERFFEGDEGHPGRLFVDVSAIIRHDAQTGIQRVVRAVWSELAKRNGEGFSLHPVYATSRHGYCHAPSDFLDSRARNHDGEPVAMARGDTFLGLDLAAHLLPKYRQQLSAWRNKGAAVHIVVYDLLPLQRPEWFSDAARSNFRKWFQLFGTEVDCAICISDDVALRLQEYLSGPAFPRIGRLHLGADMAASRPSTGLTQTVRAALGNIRARPFILMVGTIEPRKGYEEALGAFEYLWRNDSLNAPGLVIVGKSGWKTAELQNRLLSHPELGKRLHWLDRVSDEGLCKFYDSARGVLVASKGEGFGLPLMEAAAHRRHILARDLPVLREQRLPGVIYFSDDSPASLGGRLLDLLKAGEEPPRDPVRLPTWNQCVERLLAEVGITDLPGGKSELLRRVS